MTEDTHKSVGGTSQTDYSCSHSVIQNTSGDASITVKDQGRLNVYIYPTGTPGSNRESSSPDISFKQDYDKYVEGFLNKVRLYMNKKMKWDECKPFESHPTKIVVDMESVRQTDWKTVMRGDSDTLYGRDVGKVDVTQIHDPIRDNGEQPIHVMILGSAGAGKSTIASDYTLSVLNGNVEALNNIQLAYLVSTTTLQYDGQSKAFDLFFTDLMVHDKDTELTVNEQKAGEDWVKNNSSKILLTIDGLDQCAREFGGKHVYSARSDNSPATANDIIANIMSRNIWPGIQILTTARWNIYWNLRDDQRPDKVIGLRGFDDHNMVKAMLHLGATRDEAIMMVDQLPPKLLALCRNPVFLKYTVKIFNKNQSSLPNSVAGIISAFFRDFLHTCHRDDYEDLTKLAFNGMKDNIYIFLSNYLKRLGVKPGEINDFLSPGAILEEDYDVAIAADKFYTFSHQTMQEFCCALHVLNLSPTDIRNFVANKLNEEGMELTRQILYGLLLDATITNQMIGYLGQRRTSIEECRQILQEQLVIILLNGAIRDIPTLDLLSECGDDTIRQFERDIREIDINVSDLLREEQTLLTSMIKQFPFLQQVSVAEFFLVESFPVKDLKECLPYTGSFKLKRLKITYDLMTENVPHDIADLLKETRCDALDYVKCDLTTQKLARMLDEYKKKDVKLTSINTWDETMSADVYRVIAKTYAVTGCDCVSFIDCDLTKQKLECFGLGCQENELSLRMVTIIDNSMTEDGYEELGNVLEASSCQELQFQRCHLSKSKLEQLLKTCQEKDHHISKLRIMDALMPADAYWVVAAILKATKCMEVIFLNCSLTREKVCNFKMGLEENEVFLSKISVKDATMPADVYCDFAAILWKSQCRDVVFLHCNLTREKLSNFGSGLEEKKILLNFLTIIDDRMAEDGYEELATSPILKTCQELQLESCDLNTMKLNRLLTGLKNCGVHLPKLSISDSSMTAEAYSALASILCAVRCTEVGFLNCNLTENKLDNFANGSRKDNLSLSRIRIKDASMTADIYRHIATAYRDARCLLVALLDCNLDRDKLDNFAMGFKQNKITLSRLHIHDALISEDDYNTIGAVLHASQCGTVAFYNCNLTMQKIHNFGNSLKKNQISLNLLLIEDKVMEENAYREIANTMPLIRGLQLKSCDLDKTKLNGLLEGCKKEKMPLSRLIIMDPSTPEDAYTEIAAVLGVTQCRNLSFFLCNLTKNKISNFVMGCKEHQIFLSELCISDPSMPCEVYGDVAEILHATKCNISFESCNLMRGKLAHFRMRLSSLMLQNTRHLKMLTIVDKLMAAEGYGELARTLQQMHFGELMLKGCNLSKKKLAMLKDVWQTDENCQFPKLWICDTAMPGDAYGDLAALLCKTRCRNMAFLNCRLTKLKLSNMEVGCNEFSVSLSELFIVDQFMAADLYYDIAAIVQAAHCDEVTFGNCNLTKEKLEIFGLGCKDRDVSLSKLHIIDGKMPADVYSNIAATLKAAHCQKIILRECGMKKDKFKNFGIGFQDTKTSLEFLSIAGQSVAEVDYEELVRALKLSRCQDFEIGSRFLINISPNRLREEFEKQNFTLSQLRINGASAHPEMYDNVVAALCATGCDKVAFLNCYLTKERLLHFGKSLEGRRMCVSELMISDAVMQADAYSIVASIPRHPLHSCIAFDNCSLSMQKLKNLGTGFKKSERSLSKLKIMDPKLLPAVYSEVAVFLNDARCSEVVLSRSDLTKEKLTSFGNGCKEKKIYLSALSVDDREMPTESYSEISNILHVTQCRNLDFTRCNLTKQKMSNFGMECAKNQLSLHQLTIHDSEMPNDVYQELANVLCMTECEGLKLEKCEVNVAKLERLLRGCRKKNIKLENVLINDDLKTEDLYVTLARLLIQTRCSKLELENCDLDKEKLRWIGNFKVHRLPELSIADKIMSEDVYADVVTAVQRTSCTKLSLRGCELDDEKLQRLGEEFLYQKVQIETLGIADAKMEAHVYHELANTIKLSRCVGVSLAHCNLNGEKLHQLRVECVAQKVELNSLCVSDKVMTEEGYAELVHLLNDTKCTKLHLECCALNEKKIHQFCRKCKELNVTIAELVLTSEHSIGTEQIKSAVCDLKTHVIALKWFINKNGKLSLEETSRLPYMDIGTSQ